MSRAERRALRAATRQLHVGQQDRILWLDPGGMILYWREQDERLADLVLRERRGEHVWRWRASWLPWWCARLYLLWRNR